MKRSPSAGFGFAPNKNTDWLDDKNFFIYYLFLILGVAMVFYTFLFFVPIMQDKYIWTTVNITHTIVSFIMLHWLKGTPFQLTEDQGQYDKDTFWEQIDHGRQGTMNRRIFMVVPVLIFLVASYTNHWHTLMTIVNLVFLFIALVPKFDSMDHVRVGGINAD